MRRCPTYSLAFVSPLQHLLFFNEVLMRCVLRKTYRFARLSVFHQCFSNKTPSMPTPGEKENPNPVIGVVTVVDAVTAFISFA